MGKQVVVSIDREYGSGGHEIGLKLAEKLNLEFVDKNILDKVAEDTNLSYEAVARLDEKPRRIFSRSVRGYSNSPEQNIADLQFAFLKNKAIADESFVVLGRCSDFIFKEICPCISIFISGHKADRIKCIAERDNVKPEEALRLINKYDKAMSAYHDYYCNTKWGSASSYDICINSSVLGIDSTVNYLYEYVQEFLKK